MFSKVRYLVIVGLMFVGGCAAMPKSVSEAVTVMDKLSQIAEKNGAAWSAELEWDGTLAVQGSQRAEVDSGVKIQFRAHGNAASERQSVSNTNE